MIELVTPEGTTLDLKRKTAMRFDFVNSLFDETEVRSMFNIPFDLPGSFKNKKALNLPHIIGNAHDFKGSRKIEVKLLGQPWMVANMQIISVADDIKITLKLFEDGYNSITDKNLQEFEYGGNRSMTSDFITHMSVAAAGTIDDSDYTFAPVRNLGLTDVNQTGSANGNTTGVVNAYDPALPGFIGSGSPSDYAVQPYVYVMYVLQYVLSQANLTYKSELFDSDEMRTLVFTNASWKRLDYQANILSRSINLTHHVPGLTVTEFLNELRKLFRMGVFFDFFDTSRIEFTTFNQVLRNEIIDLTPYKRYVKPIIEFDLFNETGYTLIQEPDSNDEQLGPDYEYTVDDGSEQVPFKISYPYVATYTETNIGSVLWKIPMVSTESEQVLFSDYPTNSVYNYSKAAFSSRMMFYRGMQDSSTGDYPMLTPDNTDRSSAVIGEYSLHWDGDNGLFNTFHKEYYRFIKRTKRVKFIFELPAHIVVQLRMDIRIKVLYDYFLIEKLSFDFNNDNERVICEADLLTI